MLWLFKERNGTMNNYVKNNSYINTDNNSFSGIDLLSAVKGCFDRIALSTDNLKHLNIMLVGKSGVGKSTLINNLFRERLALTGGVRPVTHDITGYSKPNFPLTVYDSRGFELNKLAQKSIKKQITSTITKCASTGRSDDAIHCLLYCINSGSRRIEPEELNWIRELTSESFILKVPVIIVLTQSYSAPYTKQLSDFIYSQNLGVNAVVPVLAEDYDLGMGQCVTRYGLDQLVSEIERTLSDDLSATLANVQTASADLKQRKASLIVTASTAEAAAAVAVTPLPVADSVVLVAIQTKMLAEITTIFGLGISRSFISLFLSTALGTSGATVGGRALASALKLIPGIGTAAGGMINAGVASAITSAMGNAYIQLRTMILNGQILPNELESNENIEKIFSVIDRSFRFQNNNNNFKSV